MKSAEFVEPWTSDLVGSFEFIDLPLFSFLSKLAVISSINSGGTGFTEFPIPIV